MATYEYIIRNDSGDSERSPVAKVSTNNGNAKPKEEQGLSAKQVYNKVRNAYVVRETVSIVRSEINYKANTVELRTGARDLQQKVDFTMGIVERGLSVIGAAAGGLVVGGPAGAASAAAVTLLSQIIGTVQSISQTQRTIDLKQAIEDEQIRMNALRAGTRGSRGRYE